MSFLSKSKEMINKGGATVNNAPPKPAPPKPGSLPKPPKPPAKPGAGMPKPLAKPGAGIPKSPTNVTPPPVENGGLMDKENPFKIMKKKAEEEANTSPIKVIEQTPVEEPVAKEVVEEVAKEVAKEETPIAKPVEEVKEEIKEEPVVEEKKPAQKKKAAAKKTTVKKAEEPAPTESVPVVFDNASVKTAISFDEAMVSIKSGFIDNEWESFRKDTEERLSAIIITNDMNSTALKAVLADLNELKTALWSKFTDTKSQFEALSVKEPAGLIERVKLLNSKGANAEERKVNGVLAVMNYKDGNGNNINLFELLDEVRERYNFLRGLMDTISYKSNLLVTMLGGMKLEK